MKRVIHFFYIAVVLLLLPSCGYNLRDVVALQDMKSHEESCVRRTNTIVLIIVQNAVK